MLFRSSGPGIPRDKLERILRGEDGGLGLSIVHRLLEQNSGTLHIYSTPGQGTQMVLNFHGTGGSNEV